MKRSLACLAKVELDFLLKKSSPSPAPLQAPPSPSPIPADDEINLAHALKTLKKIAWSPRNKASQPVSKLFQQNSQLYQLPEANSLLIRDYIKWNDFSTAHAFILRCMDRLTVKDINYFLMKSFSASENSKHLVSVFEAAVDHFPRERPQIAAYTLVGLKLLQESQKYDQIKNWCHKMHLDRTVPLLQVQLFNLYLAGKYDEALELSRTIKSRTTQHEQHHELMFPYRWATLHAARNGDLKLFSTLTHHLQEIDERPTKSMSNMVLCYFPVIYPDIPLNEWLIQWKKHGWPITNTSIQIMVDHLARQFPEIGDKIWAKSDSLAKSANRQRPISLLKGRHSPFFQELRASLYYDRDIEKSMNVLAQLNRNGIVPSYDYYVHLYQQLVKRGNENDLEIVKRQMLATKYSLHCAGIDLAILERRLVDLNMDSPTQQRQLSQLLVQDYLVQYPLSVHDIVHLTRIAYIHKHYLADYEAAEHILEFRRMCTRENYYNYTNHDKKSLTLLLEVGKFKPDEWLIQLLKDEPQIIFDFEFRRALSLGLKRNKLDQLRKPMLEKVRQHNSKITKRALSQIEAMYSMA